MKLNLSNESYFQMKFFMLKGSSSPAVTLWRTTEFWFFKRHIPFLQVTLYFNWNKSPTRCNSFPVYYPDVYLQLNMFRALSRTSSGAQWLQWQPLVLPSERGDSRAVFVVQYTVSGNSIRRSISMPETCWAASKRQAINL